MSATLAWISALTLLTVSDDSNLMALPVNVFTKCRHEARGQGGAWTMDVTKGTAVFDFLSSEDETSLVQGMLSRV
jgi:hypothetical protein